MPLALVFGGTEVASGFELRAGGPATVLVPVGGGAGGVEEGLFGGESFGEVGVGVNLLGPVGVDVLAVDVDEGEIAFGGNGGGVGRDRIEEADIADADVDEAGLGGFKRPLEVELDGGDLVGGNGARSCGVGGGGVEMFVGEKQADGAGFAGIEGDAGVGLAVSFVLTVAGRKDQIQAGLSVGRKIGDVGTKSVVGGQIPILGTIGRTDSEQILLGFIELQNNAVGSIFSAGAASGGQLFGSDGQKFDLSAEGKCGKKESYGGIKRAGHVNIPVRD